MDQRKKIMVGIGIFVGLFIVVSVIYLVFNYVNGSKDSAISQDPITGGFTKDLPPAAGFEDDRTTITSLTFLSDRGMTHDQANFFGEKIVQYIDQSDLKHDKTLRIKKDSITRQSTSKGIETKFDLYLNDQDFLKINLVNDFAELNTVDVTASKEDGTVIYEEQGA